MKKIKIYPSGKEIKYNEGQTVLAALEKAGYAIPNNCRAGACGECKVKVRSGEIDQGFILDMALPQSERDEGYGLMCMAKLKSDELEIEWGTEDAKPQLFPPRTGMPHIVLDKNLVTPSIMKIRLKAIGEPMRFWPGQYVILGDESKGVHKRAYSIASIPNNEGEFCLHVTKVEGGKASNWLHDEVDEGEIISVDGAYGTFIGDPGTETPVLCLASGSGLAPICSLACAALLRGGFKKPATILFSARTNQDVYEKGIFNFLQNKFRNFKFDYTLTGEKNPNGLEGRIPEILPNLYENLSGTSIYIAGNIDFVDACEKKVLELGADKDLIFKEGFFDQITQEVQK